MTEFNFKHHKYEITGLLTMVQTASYVDKKGKPGEKIVIQLLCNNYDPDSDTFRKADVEQVGCKSLELLPQYMALLGKVVRFPVATMKNERKELVSWIPLGTVPVLAPSLPSPSPLSSPLSSVSIPAALTK